MTAPLDIPALKALDAAATPGPWEVVTDYFSNDEPEVSGFNIRVSGVDGRQGEIIGVEGIYADGEANAAFIAAARTALPGLVERVEELEAGFRAVVAWADEFRLPARHDLRLIAKPLLNPPRGPQC